MKKYRHEKILQILSEQGNVQIGDLAAHFSVTPMTIRRDLNELGAEGALIRTHGGAMPIHQIAAVDTPFHYRQSFHSEEKRLIAETAKTIVMPGQKLFLSSGSTLHAFALALADVPNITIVTDAVNIANELAVNTNMTIVLIGGEVRGNTFSTTGSVAEKTLLSFYFDAAFLGVTAVDCDGQLYLGSISELGIAQRLFSMTENVCLLADSSKLGRTDFVRIGEVKPTYTLITDDGVSPALVDLYRSLGVKVIIAKRQ
jgi:DeoR/GlpR family transcriptional regulator of sugar metabolism